MPITARTADSVCLLPDALLKGARQLGEGSHLPGSVHYETTVQGDGIEYRFPKGTLAEFSWLWADFLLDGNQGAVLSLKLREEDGREFVLTFAMLNQCQARLRLPLSAVDQNIWMLGREGALLKRLCGGDRVELQNVNCIQLCLQRHGPKPSCWSVTSLVATTTEPALPENPILPAGPLLDAIGQSTLHDWPTKTPSGVALHHRLKQQYEEADGGKWPEHFSRWGGWKAKQFGASGFFRIEHDGRRWWLVDPDGHAFWSTGPDCVQMSIDSCVEHIHKAARWLPAMKGPFLPAWHSPGKSANFLASNFIRVFGHEWRESWIRITLSQLKQIGFNTVANWSDWRIAQAAGFPYVRPMEFRPTRTKCIFRDFPDVFALTMEMDAADYAAQLQEHVGDRAFIGYFLMNEPTWGFAGETPAEGMLFNTDSCATRDALASHLLQLYGSDTRLSQAWQMSVTLDRVRTGRWHGQITDACRADLTGFATVMVQRYFTMLCAACKQVDPDHLNLGARYYTVPPQWALAGMTSFDVFSINCYRSRVPAQQLQTIMAATGRPTLIGEWHFGALDAGLPATGIGFVGSQEDRGRAYRVYLETAAAIPQCIGVHYFTLYDQSALGRYDGENYNIGFLDVCNRPYEPLVSSARQSHERMYQIAEGTIRACEDAPQYYPPLFM